MRLIVVVSIQPPAVVVVELIMSHRAWTRFPSYVVSRLSVAMQDQVG